MEVNRLPWVGRFTTENRRERERESSIESPWVENSGLENEEIDRHGSTKKSKNELLARERQRERETAR